MSTSKTFFPEAAIYAAMFTQVVVLPTPPFWLENETIFPTFFTSSYVFAQPMPVCTLMILSAKAVGRHPDFSPFLSVGLTTAASLAREDRFRFFTALHVGCRVATLRLIFSKPVRLYDRPGFSVSFFVRRPRIRAGAALIISFLRAFRKKVFLPFLQRDRREHPFFSPRFHPLFAPLLPFSSPRFFLYSLPRP